MTIPPLLFTPKSLLLENGPADLQNIPVRPKTRVTFTSLTGTLEESIFAICACQSAIVSPSIPTVSRIRVARSGNGAYWLNTRDSLSGSVEWLLVGVVGVEMAVGASRKGKFRKCDCRVRLNLARDSSGRLPRFFKITSPDQERVQGGTWQGGVKVDAEILGEAADDSRAPRGLGLVFFSL